jgi:hypothetical protein
MKRIHNIILACALVALAGCAGTETQPTTNPADVVPKKFTFKIVTVVGRSYDIQLKDGLLEYSVTQPGEKRKAPLHRAPTEAQWQEFRHRLDGLKVWRWKSDYGNKQFTGGTQWSLDIEYSDHAVHSEGHRDFPKHFDSFLKAIGDVLGSGKID